MIEDEEQEEKKNENWKLKMEHGVYRIDLIAQLALDGSK